MTERVSEVVPVPEMHTGDIETYAPIADMVNQKFLEATAIGETFGPYIRDSLWAAPDQRRAEYINLRHTGEENVTRMQLRRYPDSKTLDIFIETPIGHTREVASYATGTTFKTVVEQMELRFGGTGARFSPYYSVSRKQFDKFRFPDTGPSPTDWGDDRIEYRGSKEVTEEQRDRVIYILSNSHPIDI